MLEWVCLRIHAVKENAEALIEASKEIGLEVNVKTKYIVVYRDQKAWRGHGMKIDITSFEMVEEFRYLGIALANQNSVQEEIKSRLQSGNACYHLVQNVLCSGLLSRNINIKI